MTNREVYLEEKVVSQQEYCVSVGKKCYEFGETYHDFIAMTADSISHLSDKILRELYARGFSTRALLLMESDRISLEYSFLSDEPWQAKKMLRVIALGDVTDEKDRRRDAACRGKWFSYTELVKQVGSNEAHKIFEKVGE